LLPMLLVRISSYLKLVLRYKFLILDTYHPDTWYLRKQECEDSWYFFKGRRVCKQTLLENTDLDICSYVKSMLPKGTYILGNAHCLKCIISTNHVFADLMAIRPSCNWI
jgi:hypothetical protein